MCVCAACHQGCRRLSWEGQRGTWPLPMGALATLNQLVLEEIDPSRLFKRLHYRLVNASAEEETLLTALSMHSVSFNTPCSFQCFSWDVRAPPCCIHCVIPQATHPALFLASVYEFHGCGLHQNHIQKSALIRSALLCAVVAVPMSVCVVCKMCCRLRVSLKVYLGALRGFRSVLLHI